jgi:hypothetical protein
MREIVHERRVVFPRELKSARIGVHIKTIDRTTLTLFHDIVFLSN